MAGYYSEASRLLKLEKGWFKTILLAGLGRAIPVVGWFGETGYFVEWARLTAWGVDSAPKKSDVDLSVCLAAGWRSFAAAIGYIALWSAISWFLGSIGMPFFLTSILGLFVSFVVGLAMLVAAVYDEIGAGYGFKRIIDLIKNNPRDIMSIIAFDLIFSIIVYFVAFFIMVIFFSLLIMPVIAGLGLTTGMSFEPGTDPYSDISVLLSLLGPVFGTLIIGGIVLYICAMIVYSYRDAIYYTMIGLFLRKTNVSAWGDISDDLPKVLAFDPTPQNEPVQPVSAEQAPANEPAAPVAPAAPVSVTESAEVEVAATESETPQVAAEPENTSEVVDEKQPEEVVEPQEETVEQAVPDTVEETPASQDSEAAAEDADTKQE